MYKINREENKEHLYSDEELFIRSIEYNNTTAIHKEPCTEIFLQGCLRAHEKNPCMGCFNPETHRMDDSTAKLRSIEFIAKMLLDDSQRKLTICGGEPMLQSKQLSELCKLLRQEDDSFLIYSYTGLDLEVILEQGMLDTKGRYLKFAQPEHIREYVLQLDLIVDGEFQLENKKPNPDKYHSVGSTNQRMFIVDREKRLLIQVNEINNEPTGYVIQL